MVMHASQRICVHLCLVDLNGDKTIVSWQGKRHCCTATTSDEMSIALTAPRGVKIRSIACVMLCITAETSVLYNHSRVLHALTRRFALI